MKSSRWLYYYAEQRSYLKVDGGRISLDVDHQYITLSFISEQGDTEEEIQYVRRKNEISRSKHTPKLLENMDKITSISGLPKQYKSLVNLVTQALKEKSLV